VCADAIAVLRAVVANLFFTCWSFEIPSNGKKMNTQIRK
jgi:hypothetical protein